MEKLRKTPGFGGAARPAYVPVLRLPLGWAISLMGACLASVALSHGWRQMIFWLVVWAAITLVLSTQTRRDHHALRRKWLGIKSKAPCRKASLWKGATLSSLSRSSHMPRRGVHIARPH